MHICHVASALTGGPATSIGLLSARQVEEGHEVSLVYSSIRDDIWAYRRRFDHVRTVVPWRVERAIGPRDIPAFLELVRILDRLAPDIVHLHCSKAGALGRLATRVLGLPCVYSSHGVSFVRTAQPLRARFYRLIEKALDNSRVPVVACSESEAAHLRYVADTLHVVPNAVDVAFLDDLAIPTKTPDAPFTIGILGLIKEQRLPALVRRLVEAAPAEWQWRWIGDGPMRSVLAGLPNLEVLGWREHRDALALLAGCDAVLHASRWEGMPNALLEAMALGLPVVVSDVVGTRDVVTDQVDGLLIQEVYSVEPYLAALTRLAADAELRAGLGRRARERVLAHHECRKVAGRWEEIYALASASRPRRAKRPKFDVRRFPEAVSDLSRLDA